MQILAVIKKHGFRLEDVSNALGITKGSLSATINGSPNVKKLIEIALVIGCSPAEFFGDWYENEGKDAQKPSQPAQPAAESASPEQPQEKDVEEFSYQDGQQQEGQQQMRMHLRGIGDIDVAMPPAPPEKPAPSEQPQGTTLVGLVRCPQCGRAIRLFAEE